MVLLYIDISVYQLIFPDTIDLKLKLSFTNIKYIGRLGKEGCNCQVDRNRE